MRVRLSEVQSRNNESKRYYRVTTSKGTTTFATLELAREFIKSNGWKSIFTIVCE